jgi:hypothetical protein
LSVSLPFSAIGNANGDPGEDRGFGQDEEMAFITLGRLKMLSCPGKAAAN